MQKAANKALLVCNGKIDYEFATIFYFCMCDFVL